MGCPRRALRQIEYGILTLCRTRDAERTLAMRQTQHSRTRSRGEYAMKRPFGVTIIGILLLLQGLALLASVAFALWVQLTHDGSELQSTLAVNLGGFSLKQWLSGTVMGALCLVFAAAGSRALALVPCA